MNDRAAMAEAPPGLIRNVEQLSETAGKLMAAVAELADYLNPVMVPDETDGAPFARPDFPHRLSDVQATVAAAQDILDRTIVRVSEIRSAVRL